MSRKLSKGLIFSVAIAVLIGAFSFNHFKIEAQNNRPIPQKKTEVKIPEVGVISVKPSSYAIDVSGYAAVKPHYELTLVSGVSGMVESINEKFESGQVVKKGEILLTLENSDYLEVLASAEETLASAQVDLYEMQREALQANAEWKNSGMRGKPDSPLVLREPQLKAAKASVAAAEKAVASAQKNVDLTTVKAPFDAIVVERNVSLGGYIQGSSELATLYSTDYFEASLALSKKDLNKLPSTIDQQTTLSAVLTDVDSNQSWTGVAKRLEQYINESNRQQSLIIAIDNPLLNAKGLVPGTFVEINIQGKKIDNLWQLPSSSLSQRGEVWYLENNTLANFSADIIGSDETYIYVVPPSALFEKNTQVLLHPLSSYLKGMQVQPVISEESSDE
ncbi:MAG: efflux RND transporter periplasmic adaptor subunit [Pseudomonadota bacterium]|nr:efflux RND transporter periplasmic adaptor subunit [Pseudomonadota bacterium]